VKVLVTGAAGFIGSHLTEALVKDGHHVTALVRPTSSLDALREVKVEVIRGDVTDVQAVEKAVRGHQLVYHLAAKVSRTRATKKESFAINVRGTENIVDAALKAGVERVIYGSSIGVYGTIRHPPVNEMTVTNPNSYYRSTKLWGEEIIRTARENNRLPVVIARIGSVIGPRGLNWLGLSSAIANGQFRMIGSGENHLHPVYVSDLVDGLRRCGEVREGEGQTYILAGREPVTLKQFVKAIADAWGVDSRIGHVASTPFRQFHALARSIYRFLGVEVPFSHRYEMFLTDNIFDIAKARRELGYSPQVSIAEAVRRTVQWYREQGYL